MNGCCDRLLTVRKMVGVALTGVGGLLLLCLLLFEALLSSQLLKIASAAVLHAIRYRTCYIQFDSCEVGLLEYAADQHQEVQSESWSMLG